jgi:hypothetical protein
MLEQMALVDPAYVEAAEAYPKDKKRLSWKAVAAIVCVVLCGWLIWNFRGVFLYGGSGLGKTHLLQAIGNYFIENYPKKRVLYTTSEKFTYELINAIQKKNNQDFRNKYRNVDLLLIDDVQFFGTKELAQEEIYGTVLRAKGIVDSENAWLHFDYVPGEADVREGSAAVTGRLCVIGCKLNEEKLKTLFGV